MATGSQLNPLPTSQEAIGQFGEKQIPVGVSSVWYKFFQSIASLYTSSSGGGGGGASALLDTIGNEVGGMLSRFGSGWQEFVASQANQIPVMNPGGVPVVLKSISQLLDLISNVRGSVLYRGALGWQVLAPVVGGYLQSQGPGADPQYAASTSGNSVATGLVAAGTTQGTALALTVNWNEVTTVAVNTGVELGALGIGQPSKVWNLGANALKIYPPVGGQIDALGVNVAYSLPVNKCQELDQLTATQWRSTQLG